MTCLADGRPSAALLWGSTHPLAALLCLDCLAKALAVPAAGSGVEPQTLRRRSCSGVRGTCPAKVTRHGVNASWCAAHAPARRPEPRPARPNDPRRGDDGPAMGEAVLAALQGLGGAVLRTYDHAYGDPLPTHEPLEGQQ